MVAVPSAGRTRPTRLGRDSGIPYGGPHRGGAGLPRDPGSGARHDGDSGPATVDVNDRSVDKFSIVRGKEQNG
jgi:hypothetical protein